MKFGRLIFVMVSFVLSDTLLVSALPTGTTFGYQNIVQVAPTKPGARARTPTLTPEQITLNDNDNDGSSEEEEDQVSQAEEDAQGQVAQLVEQPNAPSEEEEIVDEGGEGLQISSTEGENERLAVCPNTTKEFRYDLLADNCNQIGTKANCGDNMTFQEDPDNFVIGFCDCNMTASAADRPLIFHEESNACFPVYTQSYCSKGQWLAFSSRLQPTCSPATCKKSGYVPLNGDGPCVKLNAESKHCEPEDIVVFASETVVPTCQRNSTDMLPRVLAAPSSNCSPGSYRSLTGRCLSGWSWS